MDISMEALQLFILSINVFALFIMASFLVKNRDLKGRLFFAEQLQDKLRKRVKALEVAVNQLRDPLIKDRP